MPGSSQGEGRLVEQCGKFIARLLLAWGLTRRSPPWLQHRTTTSALACGPRWPGTAGQQVGDLAAALASVCGVSSCPVMQMQGTDAAVIKME